MSGIRVARGKYTGNGSATARAVATGFKPAKINIISVEGKAVFQENAPAFKDVDGAKPVVLADGSLVAEELQFKIASADDSLNKNNVVYYFEAAE